MESIANQQKSLKALLSEKKDHRRVLLLYGRDDAQHYLIDQQEALIEFRDDVAKHDLDTIIIVASELQEPDRQFLMHEYKLVPSEDFVGWLMDKDGSIKETYKKPVSPHELFKAI